MECLTPPCSSESRSTEKQYTKSQNRHTEFLKSSKYIVQFFEKINCNCENQRELSLRSISFLLVVALRDAPETAEMLANSDMCASITSTVLQAVSGKGNGMGMGWEGKGREGKGREGKGREGKGREGKGREGKGREGKGRKGKEREGKERKGKERKGKGREGKGREGKGREGEVKARDLILFCVVLVLRDSVNDQCFIETRIPECCVDALLGAW